MKKLYITPSAQIKMIGMRTNVLENLGIYAGSKATKTMHMLGNERKEMDSDFDFRSDDANQVDWDF